MLLNDEDREIFFTTNLALLYYAGQELGITSKKLSYKGFCRLGIEQKYNCRTALLENAGIIDEYIASNYDHLTEQQVALLEGYKLRVCGGFIILKCLSKHAIFIGASNNQYYAVKGLSDPVDDILDRLPAYIDDVTLLPYGSQIIYDGFFKFNPIYFGSSITRDLNAGYKRAKTSGEIITTLI